MTAPSNFEGPFRRELPDGTLVYLDRDGCEQYSCARQHPDMEMAADEEPGRWWRNCTLETMVLHAATWPGLSLETIADSCSITASLALAIMRGLVANGRLSNDAMSAVLLNDLKARRRAASASSVRHEREDERTLEASVAFEAAGTLRASDPDDRDIVGLLESL